MGANSTGTPTSLGIPTLNLTQDFLKGDGINEIVAALNTIIGGRLIAPAGATDKQVIQWSNSGQAFIADFVDPANLKQSGATTGQALVWNGTKYAPATSVPDFIQFQYQQPSGTVGGTAAAGAWTKYPLNTKVSDTAGHVSTFTANQFILDAGTYIIINGHMVGTNTFHTTLRLRNTTGAATLVVGMSSTRGANNGGDTEISGKFTVAAAQTLELDYWAATATNTNDLGFPASSGEIEVYGTLDLLKVA